MVVVVVVVEELEELVVVVWVGLSGSGWIWMDLREPWRPGAHFSMILI